MKDFDWLVEYFSKNLKAKKEITLTGVIVLMIYNNGSTIAKLCDEFSETFRSITEPYVTTLVKKIIQGPFKHVIQRRGLKPCNYYIAGWMSHVEIKRILNVLVNL